jgi:hypothetical protein
METGKGKVLQFKPKNKYKPKPQPTLPPAMAMALKPGYIKAA